MDRKGTAPYDRLVFELSSPGRMAYSLPEPDVDVQNTVSKPLPSELTA